MNRGTLIMGALIVGLGGYLLWDMRTEKAETARKEEFSKIFAFKADQVNEIRLERSDLNLKVTRSEDGWKLESPIQDMGDNDFIDDLVNRLVLERSLETAKEGEGIDFKVFGLEPPAGSLTLRTQAGEEKTIEVSTISNYEQNVYIREKGAAKVLVGAGTWPPAIARGVLDFRNKKLFRGKIASVDQLEVRNANGITRLTSQNGKWIVSDHADWEIDQNRVRELLSMINETRVDDFALSRLPTAAEKARLGLDKPTVTLRAKVGEATWMVEFGTSKEGIPHALVSDPPMVLRMDSGGYQKFNRIEAGDLRDKRLPFDFNQDLTRKIDIRTRVKTNLLEKKDGAWHLAGDSKEILDVAAVEAMLKSLRESQAAHFGERRFRNPPALVNSMKLFAEDGAVVFEMSWSDPQVRKIGDRETNVRWAKTSKYRDHFWFDEMSLEKLQLNQLTAPPEAQSAPAASEDKAAE